MNIKVIHKKLGRERAWGQADTDNKIIELDERLKGYRYLLYAIHEYLHIANPEWSETKVKRESSKMTKFLWGIGVKGK
jgi:hypothetical protein